MTSNPSSSFTFIFLTAFHPTLNPAQIDHSELLFYDDL